LENTGNNGVVGYAEIAEATPIEAFAEVRDILGRKFAACMKANLVEHPRKPNHSFCPFVWAARGTCHAVNMANSRRKSSVVHNPSAAK
jgi:hypothetical protein